MSNRFEKIASVLADRYVAQQNAKAEQEEQKTAGWWGDVTGENQQNKTFSRAGALFGAGAGASTELAQPLREWWHNYTVRNNPFRHLNDPGVLESLANPQERFLRDLLKTQEFTEGGGGMVGRFLGNLSGPARLHDPAYRAQLTQSLEPFFNAAPKMRTQFNDLFHTLADTSRREIGGIANRFRDLAYDSSRFSQLERSGLLKLVPELQEANTATKLNEALGKVREFIERPAKKVQKGTGWGLKLERPSYDEARNILRDAERISPVSRPDPNLMDDLARGVGKVTTFKPRPIRLGRGIGGRAAAGAAVGGAVLPMFLDWAIPEKWRRDPQQPPKR